MQIISNIALISINETFIVQIISFLIFLYIINRIMFQPLRSIMADRENHIKSVQQDIVTADHKLGALADQIRAQESAVKSEAFAQKSLLEEAGSRRADEIFADTRKEIEAARAKAQIEVDAQLLEAKKHIEEQSEILMLSVMEKVLNRRLNP
jgi:F-type H+-transporting ATPase subunit b